MAYPEIQIADLVSLQFGSYRGGYRITGAMKVK